MSTRRPLVAAFDFDGVIAEYDGWKGIGVMGEPKNSVVSVMRTLKDEGWKIIIYTTRGVYEISKYLNNFGIPYDEINRNSDIDSLGSKPIADVYIDDRAVCYWKQSSDELLVDIQTLIKYKERA